MTIEDVDWMLRYPSDELVMSRETFNQLQAAITASNRDQHLLQHTRGMDDTGRTTSQPATLADRKLTFIPGSIDSETAVTFRVKGIMKARVVFG